MTFAIQLKEFRTALKVNEESYGLSLSEAAVAGLSEYYELLNAWNARLHLVAPISPKGFATRHVLESLLLLQHLPEHARIVDVGSGAGLPIIPCLVARPDIQATLLEASKKKAVFLREALNRISASERVTAIAERFESVPTPAGSFVTCRALERFETMLPRLMTWAPAEATLLLFGGEGLRPPLDNYGFVYKPILIPRSTRRFLFVVRKV
jgi:16S rRNA (guanine527-N7)-methyltransferase